MLVFQSRCFKSSISIIPLILASWITLLGMTPYKRRHLKSSPLFWSWYFSPSEIQTQKSLWLFHLITLGTDHILLSDHDLEMIIKKLYPQVLPIRGAGLRHGKCSDFVWLQTGWFTVTNSKYIQMSDPGICEIKTENKRRKYFKTGDCVNESLYQLALVIPLESGMNQFLK